MSPVRFKQKVSEIHQGGAMRKCNDGRAWIFEMWLNKNRPRPYWINYINQKTLPTSCSSIFSSCFWWFNWVGDESHWEPLRATTESNVHVTTLSGDLSYARWDHKRRCRRRHRGKPLWMCNGLDTDVSKAGVVGVSVATVSERKKIEKKKS